MRLLLIEDDIPLSDGLARALRQTGYTVAAALTAGDACAALDASGYDLVILDLGLPDLDGSEVVRHLARLKSDTPVLVLSARDVIRERVRLLDLGADDYLVKPVALVELQARVRALLRRRRASADSRIPLGRMSLDMEGKRAYVDGRPVDMNAREWTLLAFLAARPNRVVTREDIVGALFSDGREVADNTVEVIVSRFRRKIAPARLRLRALRGLGYFLETTDAPGS